MRLRRGVWFAGELPVGRMVDLARRAEDEGVDSVWMAEGYYARDAFMPLVAIAAVTSRVELVTGVVNPYTRHPALLAMSFATLDELSQGRAVIGLGSGERHQIEGQMGYAPFKPVTAVKEAVEVIQGMLTGKALQYRGSVFRADGVRLAFRPGRSRLPLVLAAVGPKMCALAGRMADAVYFPQTSPLYVREATGWVRTAAQEAGRDPGQVEIAAMIIMSVSADRTRARHGARPLLGLLLTVPEGEMILEKNGLDPAGAGRLREALVGGGVRAMAAAVTDEMVARLTISGTPTECRSELDALIEAGVTYPVVSLIGDEPESAIALVASLKA
jgi:5,10-methylenetetrahydromethanopterin reductase